MSGVVSASVSGPSLAFADAYATALAVAGVSGLAAPFLHDGYDAYLITADGGEEATSSFPFAVEGSAGCGDEACASPET
jgi:thiamine biosynthesis lipoprotein ApbE